MFLFQLFFLLEYLAETGVNNKQKKQSVDAVAAAAVELLGCNNVHTIPALVFFIHLYAAHQCIRSLTLRGRAGDIDNRCRYFVLKQTRKLTPTSLSASQTS